MATRRGDWVAFSKRLVEELQSKMEVWMSIEDIKAASGTTMTIEALRNRGYWKACREGRKDFDTHTKRGLALQEHMDASGRVVAVTYRLAKAQFGV